jgi:hypothetical protein
MILQFMDKIFHEQQNHAESHPLVNVMILQFMDKIFHELKNYVESHSGGCDDFAING